jgi:hypothetical protein
MRRGLQLAGNSGRHGLHDLCEELAGSLCIDRARALQLLVELRLEGRELEICDDSGGVPRPTRSRGPGLTSWPAGRLTHARRASTSTGRGRGDSTGTLDRGSLANAQRWSMNALSSLRSAASSSRSPPGRELSDQRDRDRIGRRESLAGHHASIRRRNVLPSRSMLIQPPQRMATHAAYREHAREAAAFAACPRSSAHA